MEKAIKGNLDSSLRLTEKEANDYWLRLERTVIHPRSGPQVSYETRCFSQSDWQMLQKNDRKFGKGSWLRHGNYTSFTILHDPTLMIAKKS